MITTITYSQSDLRKRCHGCKWLQLEDNEVYGECTCKHNRIKNRFRSITDHKCSWKNADLATSA